MVFKNFFLLKALCRSTARYLYKEIQFNIFTGDYFMYLLFHIDEESSLHCLMLDKRCRKRKSGVKLDIARPLRRNTGKAT